VVGQRYVVTHEYSQERKYNATLIVMDDFSVTGLDGSMIYIPITIVPEFPSILMLPLFMITTLLAILLHGRRRIKRAWKPRNPVWSFVS
jgi:hypothetical protein